MTPRTRGTLLVCAVAGWWAGLIGLLIRLCRSCCPRAAVHETVTKAAAAEVLEVRPTRPSRSWGNVARSVEGIRRYGRCCPSSVAVRPWPPETVE